MRITNFEIKEQTDTVEVSADVDGFRLWYRLPKAYPVSRTGDPFLAAAFLPAMVKNETLEIDQSLPVSPKLLENVFLLQEIHHCWNPVLKMIPICATTSPAEPLNAGAFSFFSGGVDSMFTFFKRIKEISHVVFIHGFDFSLENDIYQSAVARNSSFVRNFGKILIPVETNLYHFGLRYNLSRVLTQGSALASVALLLGFSRVYLPSSSTYNHLFPLGSHPLTDPLYSNECVEIIHDGAEATRGDKVIKIAERESALVNLRVCFDDVNVNCGKCEKCLRTMIPLKLLRALAAPFPPLPSLKAIRKMRINDTDLMDYKESFDLALQVENKALGDAIYACMKRYERRKLVKEFDRVFLGGLLKRTYRRIMKDTPDRVGPSN
jgi:hypothetical protein